MLWEIVNREFLLLLPNPPKQSAFLPIKHLQSWGLGKKNFAEN